MVDSLENPSTTTPITKNMLRQKIRKSQNLLHFSEYKGPTRNVDNDLTIRSVPKNRHRSVSVRNRAIEVKNEADTHQASGFEIQKIQTSPKSAFQRCKKADFRISQYFHLRFSGFKPQSNNNRIFSSRLLVVAALQCVPHLNDQPVSERSFLESCSR